MKKLVLTMGSILILTTGNLASGAQEYKFAFVDLQEALNIGKEGQDAK